MSTDFSIKPVGAPVVTTLVQPAGQAANGGVATQLPPSQAVTAAEASVNVRNNPQSSGDSLSRQAYVDSDAASIVYQVVDNRTSLVVRQFPDEAMLRRRAYFRALDLVKQEREQTVATDRRA
jgi:hypothetical protein